MIFIGEIELKSVVKKFGDFTAVDNVNLVIKEGELFGLLGPNGAGKTTIINMILGLLKPTHGSITIDGLDNIKHAEDVKSRLGLMTQETVVEGDLTANENLTLFAELYHVPQQEIPKKVKAALADADLTGFADKRAGTFSGGMQRRLELVKAMIQEPRILIMDEPTTGLDVQNRSSMWERIKHLNKNGVTMILTTQYLEEADELCDRIAIIDHGKIKAIGTPTELKRMVGTGRVLEMIIEDIKRVPEVVDMLKRQFKLTSTFKSDKIITVIETDHGEILTRITGAIERKKIVVSSVSLHLPTLDDVFIKLTGAGLRDAATAEFFSARNNVMLKMR